MRVLPMMGVLIMFVLVMIVMIVMAVLVTLVLVMIVMILMAVLVMLVLVMPVMILVAMFVMLVLVMLVMIVMILVAMLVMVIVVVMIIMVMRIKGTTLTERQFGQTMRLHQRDGLGVGRDAFNRVFKKRLEIMAHPEHQLRILKQLRLRWLQRVCVRRPGPLYQKAWLTHPCHHRRYKRMNRLDRCHHLHVRLGQRPAG